MEVEIWMPIPKISDYLASSLGRIKSLKKGKERILKPCVSKASPYQNVKLRIDGFSKTMRVHVLVALAFIENPKNKRTVNHKDTNKLNNRADNLEWATHAQNTQHMMLNNLNPQYIGVLNLENGIFYDRALDAAIAHKIVPSTLYARLSGHLSNNTALIKI